MNYIADQEPSPGGCILLRIELQTAYSEFHGDGGSLVWISSPGGADIMEISSLRASTTPLLWSKSYPCTLRSREDSPLGRGSRKVLVSKIGAIRSVTVHPGLSVTPATPISWVTTPPGPIRSAPDP